MHDGRTSAVIVSVEQKNIPVSGAESKRKGKDALNRVPGVGLLDHPNTGGYVLQVQEAEHSIPGLSSNSPKGV